MYATHDSIEEIECDYCKGKVPYYDIIVLILWEKKNICEYCLDEMYQPETI